MRKLLAGAAVLVTAGAAALGAGAPPAGAHAEHGTFVEWYSPDEGAQVSGAAIPIRAKIAFGPDGVRHWAVSVTPQGAESGGFGTICEETPAGEPYWLEIDCTWDTSGYPAGGVSANGPYRVRITATNGERASLSAPPEPHHADRAVTVVNPISAPRDVRLDFAEDGNLAMVRWKANPEPDIDSYVVQERFGNGSWNTVGQTDGRHTTFVRKITTPGTYRYQVAAVRPASGPEDSMQSAFSGPATKPDQITVEQPPPVPATTTTRPREKGRGAPPGDPDDDARSGKADDKADGKAAPKEGRSAAGATGPEQTPLITPIAPGAPGSVSSQATSAGNLVVPGPAPAPVTPTTVDTGFSETLPYAPRQGGPAPAVTGDDEEAVARFELRGGTTVVGDDKRALLLPLAAGLALFVLAMHALHLSRRTGVASLEAD